MQVGTTQCRRGTGLASPAPFHAAAARAAFYGLPQAAGVEDTRASDSLRLLGIACRTGLSGVLGAGRGEGWQHPAHGPYLSSSPRSLWFSPAAAAFVLRSCCRASRSTVSTFSSSSSSALCARRSPCLREGGNHSLEGAWAPGGNGTPQETSLQGAGDKGPGRGEAVTSPAPSTEPGTLFLQPGVPRAPPPRATWDQGSASPELQDFLFRGITSKLPGAPVGTGGP